jgi:hypothetical protein
VNRQLAAVVILAVFALDGCATVRGQSSAANAPPVAAEPGREGYAASIRQECHRSAAGAVESKVLASALESAGLASVYLVLRGAADGAWWGFVTGGGRGGRDGAWIGAAVGAGLGLIIGAGVGVSEGADAYERYRLAFDNCVAVRTVSMPEP